MRNLDNAPDLPEGLHWLVSGKSEANNAAIQHAVSCSKDGHYGIEGKSKCGLVLCNWVGELFSDEYCERCCRSLAITEVKPNYRTSQALEYTEQPNKTSEQKSPTRNEQEESK